MDWAIAALYGLLLAVAAGNFAMMKRPRAGDGPRVAFLIPARNEAERLPRVLPALVGKADVFVCDDDSTDGTAEIARGLGAQVISAGELPEGWTGKNRACRLLAQAASEASAAEWYAFLDADVVPNDQFVQAVQTMAGTWGVRCPVLTGFPKMLPGAGLEPLYLGWVPWILLASNPFGLVSRTGMGHNRFTNGQFAVYRASTYWEIDPHLEVCSAVLEDVRIGRLLARRRVRVETGLLGTVLSVQMYRDLREAFDGMSKNSYEVTGSTGGTLALAALLLLIAWGWTIAPWTIALLWAGKFLTDRAVGQPIWTWPFAPITATMAAVTFVRSAIWHRTGKVTWKGRVYRT